MALGVCVAVDGPASSGKTATFSRVAERLGLKFIDSGYFYRAFCWSMMNQCAGVDLDNETGLMPALNAWNVRVEPGAVYVSFGGEEEVEISSQMFETDVDNNVHRVARHPAVRQRMVELQRQLAERESPCIVLGRDITTVVLPDAPVKIYLDSSVDVRASRRYEQIQGAPNAPSFDEVRNSIMERDNTDMNRPVGPLVRAPDAIYMNTDNMTIDQAVEHAVSIIQPYSR